jgi:hypothetical protein
LDHFASHHLTSDGRIAGSLIVADATAFDEATHAADRDRASQTEFGAQLGGIEAPA